MLVSWLEGKKEFEICETGEFDKGDSESMVEILPVLDDNDTIDWGEDGEDGEDGGEVYSIMSGITSGGRRYDEGKDEFWCWSLGSEVDTEDFVDPLEEHESLRAGPQMFAKGLQRWNSNGNMCDVGIFYW